jgi:hypothetical protein
MRKGLISFLLLAASVAVVGFQGTAKVIPNQARAASEQVDSLAAFRHPKNLKVLPRHISPQDLMMTMRTFSRSLGVRCGFCHAMKPAPAGERPEPDFASDAKDEKRNARKMITMTADINKKYLRKIDRNFEVACVSCHRGNVKPMISVDSLPKHAMPVLPPPPEQK